MQTKDHIQGLALKIYEARSEISGCRYITCLVFYEYLCLDFRPLFRLSLIGSLFVPHRQVLLEISLTSLGTENPTL